MNDTNLLPMIPRCFECRDIGLTVKDGVVSTCWRLRANAPHNPQSPAAVLIGRAMDFLRIEKVAIDSHIFAVAVSLVGSTSEKPCTRDRLIGAHFRHKQISGVRNVAHAIETLRKVWLLPIGSRKEPPHGYWIITEMADFAVWVAQAKAAPITQLTTIHRVAKRNFPILAEQMDLDFWNDIEPQVLNDAAA